MLPFHIGNMLNYIAKGDLIVLILQHAFYVLSLHRLLTISKCPGLWDKYDNPGHALTISNWGVLFM